MRERDRDRIVLVTGAGNGLGAALATAFARDGARVIINNRHRGKGESSAEKLAQSLRVDGCQAIADLHAVDHPDAAGRIIHNAMHTLGGLDTLVLNAGISGTAARVDRMDFNDLVEVMSINFFANVRLVQAALPTLSKGRAGRILFISSTAGLHGLRGMSHYAASKGAINAFARTLATELKDKCVNVNVLMPYAATAMTKTLEPAQAAHLSASKVVPAALWLCSESCHAHGEFWIAGADVFRRAHYLETGGSYIPNATAASFLNPAQDLGETCEARSFADGEAAFLDLLDQAVAASRAS